LWAKDLLLLFLSRHANARKSRSFGQKTALWMTTFLGHPLDDKLRHGSAQKKRCHPGLASEMVVIQSPVCGRRTCCCFFFRAMQMQEKADPSGENRSLDDNVFGASSG
jgi:hypothetical protein